MYKPLVTVGSFALPEPSSYDGNTSTIVDEGRNVNARFIGAVVRDDIAKVSLSWRFLTVKQWADINRQFKMSAGGKFINDVTFFDQSAGTWLTRKMYVNDRSAGLLHRDKGGNVTGWLECKLALIEV